MRALLSAIGEAGMVGGPPVFLKVAPERGEGEAVGFVRGAMQHHVDASLGASRTVSRRC